jgi:putative transposase
MIERRDQKLSLSRQCQLLDISRSSIYYKPVAPKAEDLEIMRLIDEQYLKTPCWGSRSMRNWLIRKDYKINRKRIQRLMRLMGLEAIYPKPRTSRPHPQHKIYPYLLRDLVINHSNQVRAADITYIPMARGFMYLVAVMDWRSRKVLSWKLSNTLDAEFCVEALKQATERFGTPQVFNTDQGAQFTSKEFTSVLEDNDIAISMDGRGRVQDNIFIERLWWTLKHQHIYLHSFEDGVELRTGLRRWFEFYNNERPHQGLDGHAPDEVYFTTCLPVAEAA